MHRPERPGRNVYNVKLSLQRGWGGQASRPVVLTSHLGAGGPAAVPALAAVDSLGVAVDSVLGLGGVQQHLDRQMVNTGTPRQGDKTTKTRKSDVHKSVPFN